MSLGDRLLEFINYLGISKNQFGISIGLGSAENVRNLTKGITNNPRSSLLVDVLKKYPHLNARWLMTGEGKMLYDDNGKKQNYKLMHDEPTTLNDSENSYKVNCIACYNKQIEIKRLLIDRSDLLDRLERQSEEIGKFKERLNYE